MRASRRSPWQAVLSGDWMEDMETYLADQFPGRTFFVRTKATLNFLLGQREIGGAYVGSDGQLFEVFSKDLDAERLSQNAQILSQFASSQTGRVYFLPVYSAFTLYPERLPAFAQEPDERRSSRRWAFPRASPSRMRMRTSSPTRGRTSTSARTTTGRRTARTWPTGRSARRRALRPRRISRPWRARSPSSARSSPRRRCGGSPGIALRLYEIPRKVQVTYDLEQTADSLYTLSALEKKDQYTVFLDGNHARVDIETDAGTGKTLVVLQDSFAHALVPFLANHYDTIVVLDLRYYNLPVSDVLAEHPGADILLTYNLSWLAQDANLFKLLR